MALLHLGGTVSLSGAGLACSRVYPHVGKRVSGILARSSSAEAPPGTGSLHTRGVRDLIHGWDAEPHELFSNIVPTTSVPIPSNASRLLPDYLHQDTNLRGPARHDSHIEWSLDAVKWHCQALLMASTFCSLTEIVKRIAVNEMETRKKQSLGLRDLASDLKGGDRKQEDGGKMRALERRPPASSVEPEDRGKGNGCEMRMLEPSALASTLEAEDRGREDAGEMLPVLQEAATLQRQLEGMLQKLEVAAATPGGHGDKLFAARAVLKAKLQEVGSISATGKGKTLEALWGEYGKAKAEAEAYLQVARYIVECHATLNPTRPLGQGSVLQSSPSSA